MAISTEQVKQLREQTGVSVMQCKKALEEADGDEAKARDILVQKSKEAAAKKQERELGAGTITAYIHAGGTVGALVELSCESDFVSQNDEFKQLAYDVAMHVAAMNPEFIQLTDIDDAARERVKELYQAEVDELDKPPEVKEKVMQGKLDTHFNERTLMEQPFVKDGEKVVRNLIEEAVQKFGENINVTRFTRYAISS